MSNYDPWKATDSISPSPEQEREAQYAEKIVPCSRCGNPTRRLFVVPGWETCDRCTSDEREEQDMQALRRTVERKRHYGRKW